MQKYSILHPNPEPEEMMISNTLIDGFRADIIFPEIKLNIELDGPSHRYPARMKFDRVRDEYLMKKKDYQVNRISLPGKSVEEVVAEIETIVNDRNEKKTDEKIQSIYSKKKDIKDDTTKTIKYEIPTRKYQVPGRNKDQN